MLQIQKQNQLSYATEEEKNDDSDDDNVEFIIPKCDDSDIKLVDYTIHAIVHDIMTRKLTPQQIVDKIDLQQSFYDEGKGIL